MSSIYEWLTDEAKNAYIDNIVNLAEGQMPNSVNDSFRNIMQRIAEYLADQSGSAIGELVIQSGTPVTSDIHVKTASKPYKYQDGMVLIFRVHSPQFVKCNLGVTRMAMNDLESKPMYTAKYNGKQPITGTELRVGSVYTAIYTEDSWFIMNPTLLPEEVESHHNKVPHGLIFNFGMQEMPPGWLLCDGTAYNRHDYPNLYAVIGTMWGFGTEPDTFKVPDLRGLFLRGNSQQHLLGMYELDEFGRHQHKLHLAPMYEGKTPRELLEIMLGHPPIYNYNLGDYIKKYHDELFVVEDQYLGMLFFDADGYRCHPFTGKRLRCTPTPGMLLFATATTIFFSRPPMPGMEHIDPAGKFDFDDYDGYMADWREPEFELCEALGTCEDEVEETPQQPDQEISEGEEEDEDFDYGAFLNPDDRFDPSKHHETDSESEDAKKDSEVPEAEGGAVTDKEQVEDTEGREDEHTAAGEVEHTDEDAGQAPPPPAPDHAGSPPPPDSDYWSPPPGYAPPPPPGMPPIPPVYPQPEESTHPLAPTTPTDPTPGAPHRPAPRPPRPLHYDKIVRLGLKAMKTAFYNRELGTFHPKYGQGYILNDHLWREQYGAYPLAEMPLGTHKFYREDEPFEPEPFDDLYPLCKGARHTHGVRVISDGEGETRPINIAVNYGIKA